MDLVDGKKKAKEFLRGVNEVCKKLSPSEELLYRKIIMRELRKNKVIREDKNVIFECFWSYFLERLCCKNLVEQGFQFRVLVGGKLVMVGVK